MLVTFSSLQLHYCKNIVDNVRDAVAYVTGKAAGQQYPIIVQFWGRPKLYVDFRLGGRLASPDTVRGSAVHVSASG